MFNHSFTFSYLCLDCETSVFAVDSSKEALALLSSVMIYFLGVAGIFWRVMAF